MGVSASVRIDVQLTAGVWTNITADTVASMGLQIRYGVEGNGPSDCVAGTGQATFALRNDAGNSGATQGYYSPNHGSKRSGWNHSIPVRVTLTHGSDSAKSVSSLTQAAGTATATSAGHGFSTGYWVTIAGASPDGYNGVHQITVTGVDAFTYSVDSGLSSPATGTITATRAYVKFRGKIADIDPDAGQYGPQRVRVTALDGMADLMEADVREVDLQVGKTETELVTAALDALPSTAQPVARDFDTGVDTFPFAYDDLGEGVKCAGVIADVCRGAFAFYAQKGDGTHILLSRQTRALGSSQFTFTNTMHGLKVPTSLSKVFNLVRVTIRPKVVFATATEELYTLPTGAYIEVPAGITTEVWTDYTDPGLDHKVAIGGADVVTALVGGTHYSAFEFSNGTGTNLTANIGATITPFASTAKWTLVNNGAVTAYITLQKVIGKGVRNPGPQTYQSYAAKDYGVREHKIELRYQSNASTAESYATWVRTQYDTLANITDGIEFLANDSSDFLTQALAREPGDIITITEPVTGLSAITAVIHSVELDVRPGPLIVCRFGLSPAAPFQAWLLGIVGRSELGETTRLGSF